MFSEEEELAYLNEPKYVSIIYNQNLVLNFPVKESILSYFGEVQ